MAAALRFLNFTTVCYLISDTTNYYMKLNSGGPDETPTLTMDQAPDWTSFSDVELWSKFRFRFYALDREGSPHSEVAMVSDFGQRYVYEDVQQVSTDSSRLKTQDSQPLVQLRSGALVQLQNGTTFIWQPLGYQVSLSSTFNNDQMCSQGHQVRLLTGQCYFTCYPKVTYVSQATVIMVSGSDQVAMAKGGRGMVRPYQPTIGGSCKSWQGLEPGGPGAPGEPGQAGSQGVIGESGPPGQPGPVGAPAPAGPSEPGPPGKPGPSKSPYPVSPEQPKETSITGVSAPASPTIESVTATVVGPGAMGPPGQIGPPGPMGIRPPPGSITEGLCGPEGPREPEPTEKFVLYRYKYQMGRDTILQGVILRSVADGRFLTCGKQGLEMTGEPDLGCRWKPVMQADSRMFIQEEATGILRCHDNPELTLSISSSGITLEKRRGPETQFRFKEVAGVNGRPGAEGAVGPNGGTVIPGVKECLNSPLLLCGQTVYDPAVSLCCQNQVVDRPNSTVAGCCGAKAYDPATSACCEGQVKHTSIRNAACCGATPYNGQTHVCCDGKVEWRRAADSKLKCGSKTYNNACDVCCNGTLFPRRGELYTKCCGDGIMDSRTEVCCDGTPKPRYGSITLCCGSQSYAPARNICCIGNVAVTLNERKYDKMACCGHQAYDTDAQICCKDNTIQPKWSSNVKCCGNVSYDPMVQMCCSGRILSNGPGNSRISCCGSDSFDSKSSVCCEGKVYPNVGGFYRCCGGKLVNTLFQECCGDILYSKNAQTKMSCCREALYNTDNKICCDGVIHSKRDKNTRCCGRSVYDMSVGICCSNIIHPKSTGVFGCCGEEPYDINTHVCCKGKLHASDGKKMSCCGSTVYENSKSRCCESLVHPLPPNNSSYSCCGRNLYNSKTHMCCHRSVSKKAGPFSLCCGSKSFNPFGRQYICCNGSLHDKKGLDPRCCGDVMIDASKTLCFRHGDIWRWFDKITAKPPVIPPKRPYFTVRPPHVPPIPLPPRQPPGRPTSPGSPARPPAHGIPPSVGIPRQPPGPRNRDERVASDV